MVLLVHMYNSLAARQAMKLPVAMVGSAETLLKTRSYLLNMKRNTTNRFMAVTC